MKKKNEISTAKKIINEYADKINFYMKQNEVLKSQLADMTTTLIINKNILYSQLLDNSKNKDNMDVLNELKIENERVSQKNLELNKEKEILESKVNKIKRFKKFFQLRKMQSDYDEKFLNERSEIDKLHEEIFMLQQKIYEKESALVNFKRESEKNSNQETLKEIFIADPTKINVELNNELNNTRDIMAKVSKMLNAEKLKNEKLEKKYKQIMEDYDELKKISISAIGSHDKNFNCESNNLNNKKDNLHNKNIKEINIKGCYNTISGNNIKKNLFVDDPISNLNASENASNNKRNNFIYFNQALLISFLKYKNKRLKLNKHFR